MILETVRVLNPSGIGTMLINAKDFDPSIHELPKEKATMVKIAPDISVPDETDPKSEKTVDAPKKGRPSLRKT